VPAQGDVRSRGAAQALEIGPGYQTLQQRLGGRWAISLPAFGIVLLGITLSVLAGEIDATSSPARLAQWLGVAWIAALAAGCVLFIAHRTPPFRDRKVKPVKIVWVILLSVITITAISLSLSLGIHLLDLSTSDGPLLRLVSNLIFGVPLSLGIVLLLEHRDELGKVRERLIEKEVARELAQMQQGMLILEMRREFNDDVDAVISQSYPVLKERIDAVAQSPTTQTVDEMSQAMMVLVDDSVRPLSARLWKASTFAIPKQSWWKSVQAMLRTAIYYPLILAAIHAIGTFRINTDAFGIGNGALITAFGVGWIIAIGYGSNFLMRRTPSRHVEIFLAGVVLLETSTVLSGFWRESLVAGSGSLGWVVINILSGILIIALTSGLGSWQRVNAQVQAQCETDLDEEFVRLIAQSRITAELARETSRALHGSLQTRLVACAMTSEQAIASNDLALLDAALREARSLLMSPIRDESPAGSIRSEIWRKLSLWEELCVFEVFIDEQVDDDSGMADSDVLSTVVGRIVEEGVSNAIRHGDATHIIIRVERTIDGALVIEIEDDGIGPSGGSPGVGSALLDQAAGGEWSLARHDDVTRLRALVGPVV
jgi:signal transduction histidine kinase